MAPFQPAKQTTNQIFGFPNYKVFVVRQRCKNKKKT